MKSKNSLYTKIVEINNEVKQNLRRRGLVVPVRNRDGSISLGAYTVNRTEDGYTIVKGKSEIVAKQINLPQTALIIANNLAVGKFMDTSLIDKDRHYGSALFEEELAKRVISRIKNNVDKWDLMTTKCMIAQARKNYYKNQIVDHFRNFENSYK